jgi:molybdate transport system substrate-binding protein
MTTKRPLLAPMLKLAATFLALVGISLAGVARAEPPSPPQTLTVFAAASLQNVMREIGADYTKATGAPIAFNFAGSSTLARQIVEGAPVDVFISADPQWMDYVQNHGLAEGASRIDLLTNHLALIAPKGSALTLKIAPGFAIAKALGDGRLAMADPNAVPAGLYGKAALTKLGVWQEVEGRVAKGDSVRAALVFVGKGEAPLGIVYDTDAKIDPDVRIVDVFPDDSHPPILYPAAVIVSPKAPQARAFLMFLQSPPARAVFARYGFKAAGR